MKSSIIETQQMRFNIWITGINYKSLLYSLGGAIILLGFAFYNGYPIVYSDTSTYIESGFSLQPPIDRPITYGLFIRLASLNGFSLWTVAFLQSLIISFLILLSIKDFTKVKNPYNFFLFGISFLSLFTVITFVSGQIISDIFASIGILCIIHLAINKNLRKFNTILLFLIFLLANGMHMSHLLINILFILIILFVTRIFFRKTITLNYNFIWLLLIFSVSGIFLMGSSLSKSRHVFFMGRMAENGILIQFLNDNCADNKYKLCDCIDSIPTNTTDFLWDENSPVYTKYGKWSDSREEFNEIIRSTLVTPKYLSLHIIGSLKNSLAQLLYFDAGDGNGPFIEGTVLYERLKKYFPSEAVGFRSSKQSNGLLVSEKLNSLNIVYRFSIIFSLLLLILVFSSRKFSQHISLIKKYILIVLFIAIFINSFVNASLVLVTDRFGAKLIWLIPFIILLIIADFRRSSVR